jgi:hypothetical protein
LRILLNTPFGITPCLQGVSGKFMGLSPEIVGLSPEIVGLSPTPLESRKKPDRARDLRPLSGPFLIPEIPESGNQEPGIRPITQTASGAVDMGPPALRATPLRFQE